MIRSRQRELSFALFLASAWAVLTGRFVVAVSSEASLSLVPSMMGGSY